MWLSVVIAGFYFAGINIKQALDDWEQTPIMTSIESTALPINQIQFPTVTICQGKWIKVS